MGITANSTVDRKVCVSASQHGTVLQFIRPAPKRTICSKTSYKKGINTTTILLTNESALALYVMLEKELREQNILTQGNVDAFCELNTEETNPSGISVEFDFIIK